MGAGRVPRIKGKQACDHGGVVLVVKVSGELGGTQWESPLDPRARKGSIPDLTWARGGLEGALRTSKHCVILSKEEGSQPHTSCPVRVAAARGFSCVERSDQRC